MQKKVLLIINPVAGRQKIKSALMMVVDELTKADYEITIFTTQTKEKTALKLKEYDSQFSYVIISGGDGTFNEVMSALMDWHIRPEIGYLPFGTTNDFAVSLNIPAQPNKAIETALNGQKHMIDIGKWNDHYFSYIASFGIFTETSYQTPQNYKNSLGHLAYIFEGIKELPTMTAYEVHVKADYIDLTDQFIFGAVTNAKSVGGIIKMDDQFVDLQDGLLEVILVRKPKTLLDVSAILTALNTKKFDTSMFVFFQTDALQIECTEPFNWSLDGEKIKGEDLIKISCMKHALTIRQ